MSIWGSLIFSLLSSVEVYVCVSPFSYSMSAANFMEFLDETFESCDVIVGDEDDAAGEGKRLGMATLKSLIYQLELLKKQEQLPNLPLETLTRLLGLLDEHIKLALSVDLNDEDKVRCI